MQFIKLQEKQLQEHQDLKVFLVDYPSFEVTVLGHLGDNYLFFGGLTNKGVFSTLLLPAKPYPLNLIVVDSKERNVKPRRQIGFRGNLEEGQKE